jgi:hypothetical protein
MYIKIIIAFGCFLSLTPVFGQSGFNNLGGANFNGYAKAGTNLDGIGSIYSNQAGLSSIKNFAFDISAERRFNLEELSNISIAGAKSFKFGTIGVLLSNFGFSEYSEQKFGLAIARKLSKDITVGGQFDLLRLNVSQFGSINTYTFELGMQFRINNEFSIATHFFSPGTIKFNDDTELGTRFRLGLKFSPSPKVFLIAELDKLIYRSIEYKCGLGYQVVDQLQLRLGVNPSVKTFSFGAMVAFDKKYRVATAYSLNSQLGNTPSFSLQYQN